MSASFLLAGRILFSVPFLVFGIFHLRGADQMAGMVPLPGGVFWVYLTGVAQIAAAVSFLSGKQMRLAALLTALLMIIYALSLHLPGVLAAADPGAFMMSMSSLLKDVGLAGGALLLAHAVSTTKP
jgi:putative oxidoreductase